MAGDATNARLWQGADVYIAPVGSTAPTDVATALAVEWTAVGLLDGEEGFTHSRDKDTQEFYSWGGLLVRRSDSKHKRTVKFVCLEDNATVQGLVNPGTTWGTPAAGLTTTAVKTPTYQEFAMVLELRDGANVTRRVVSRAAVDEVGDIKESDSDLTVYEITVALYPETDGTVFTEISGTV